MSLDLLLGKQQVLSIIIKNCFITKIFLRKISEKNLLFYLLFHSLILSLHPHHNILFPSPFPYLGIVLNLFIPKAEYSWETEKASSKQCS